MLHSLLSLPSLPKQFPFIELLFMLPEVDAFGFEFGKAGFYAEKGFEKDVVIKGIGGRGQGICERIVIKQRGHGNMKIIRNKGKGSFLMLCICIQNLINSCLAHPNSISKNCLVCSFFFQFIFNYFTKSHNIHYIYTEKKT